MIKPTMKTQAPAYDWNECVSYLEKKYKINIRDYSGSHSDDTKPYQDFWHWICDMGEIWNGCYLEITFNEWLEDEDTPEWRKEIIRLFIKEFGDIDFRFWIEW